MTPAGPSDASETPTARQKRIWDKTAPAYDKKIAFLEKVWFAGARDWLASRAHGRTLEVAIGTGRNLPHYRSDVELTGIDLSSAMLAVARDRADGLGRLVDLHEGDAQQLPFADATFDTVTCALSLCSIPDPVAAIAEMRRVLVLGGTLVLVDHIASSWPPLRAGQWLVEQITRRTAGEYFTRRQLPLVKAAGFRIDEAERLKAGTIERIRATKTIVA